MSGAPGVTERRRTPGPAASPHAASVRMRRRFLDALATERGRRRLLWLALLLVCFVPPLVSQSGRIVADTKLPLWLAPGRYLLNSIRVWQSSPYLGSEQHDGTLFPMGVVIFLLRATHLPVWIVERLWHGLLLFTAAAGMVVLVDLLIARKLSFAQPVAASVYAFNPYTLGLGLHTTAVFLPVALLPFLLAAWVWGLRRPTPTRAVVVAGVFFLMGGANGAPQVFVLAPLAVYLLWAVFRDRSISVPSALGFAVGSAALAAGLSAWWLVALPSQGVASDLTFSEPPAIINLTSSFSENLRLLGFWGYYGVGRGGPWFPTIQPYLVDPLLVLSSFSIPVLAFLSAWRSRWRLRLLFGGLAIAAVALMAGIYPVTHPTPFGQLLLRAYRSVPGAIGLRTTYKFGAVLALSLALLLGAGAREGWERLHRAELPPWAGPGAAAAGALLLAATVLPVWTGGLYPADRTFPQPPSYWQGALGYLRARVGNGRVLFVPGSLFADYRWGGTVGGMAEGSPDLASVRRGALPVAERYGSNLLAALEQPYQQGERIPGTTAPLLRRLGVDLVVLQNDLDWARSNTARPIEVHRLVSEPGLFRAASFGTPGKNVTAPAAFGRRQRPEDLAESRLRPVQILGVSRAQPVLRAEGPDPVLVSGDAFGLAPAIDSGLIPDRQPFLYSGNLSAGDVAALAAGRPSLVITDSNRRRAWRFSGVRSNASATLPAGDGKAVGYDLFGGRVSTETVAVYRGIAGVSASSFGSPFRSEPWAGPAAALDGNRATAWSVSDLDPLGSWIRVDLDGPTRLGSLTVDPLIAPAGRRQLTAVRVDFSAGPAVTARIGNGPTRVSFPARTTRWLRVTVTGMRPGLFGGGVGIRELSIPGVTVSHALQVPTDLVDAASQTSAGQALLATAPLAYVFDRGRTDGSLPDEEVDIHRLFQVAAPRSFSFSASTRLDPQVGDVALAGLLGQPRDVSVTSSGWAGNHATNRAALALDGDRSTTWSAVGFSGQWIQITFPRRRIGRLMILGADDAEHSPLNSVTIRLSDGTVLRRPVGSGQRVEVTFRPRVLSSVRVDLDAGYPVVLAGRAQPPAGIRELSIPGVRVPAPRATDPLPCSKTAAVLLDGQPIAIRPSGTVADLLAGAGVDLTACHGAPISLDPGQHELAVGGVLSPFTVVLRSAGVAPTPTAGPSPRLTFARTLSGYRIHVTSAAAPFILVLGENAAPGWRASIDGTRLGDPLVVDGYSQGWRVDRLGSYTVDVSYGPQSRQNSADAVSVAAVLVCIAILARPRLRALVRNRRRT